MTKRIHILITRTVREAGSKPAELAWREYAVEHHYADSIQDLAAFLHSRYAGNTRRPIYVDEGRQVGWMYCWRDDTGDRRHGRYTQYLRDWVVARWEGDPILITPNDY
jgi:hypothetical protein